MKTAVEEVEGERGDEVQRYAALLESSFEDIQKQIKEVRN